MTPGLVLPPGPASLRTMNVKPKSMGALFALAALFFVGLAGLRADEGVVTKTDWHGYGRQDFIVANRPCLLIVPAHPAPGNPWIWRTEFFGTNPQADLALLSAGWHVA